MDLPLGIRRVTLPLPARPGYVHAYLVPGDDGWTVVDTGVSSPETRELWAAELAGLDVVRVFVTHFHPDHVGAAADVRDLARAPVFQGALDLEQCRIVWAPPDGPPSHDAWFARAGAPAEIVREIVERGAWWHPFVRYADDAVAVQPGDRLDGWELVAAPGHADGQLVLLRDGVLIGGDHILDPITPTVGLWPDSRPDPLGDYLDSLRAVVELAPAIVLPGHGDPIRDPVGRARALVEHHRVRLDETLAALMGGPRSAYEVSLALFGRELSAATLRFAVAETLSHLERLVVEGRAARHDETAGVVAYTSA